MAKKKDKRKQRKFIVKPLFDSCYFCGKKTTPDYKDVDVLSKFMSDRAKMYGKDRSGVCSKHQRRLAVAIKRARHLALLPYTPLI